MTQPRLHAIIRAKFQVQHALESQVERHLSADVQALDMLRDKALESLTASDDMSQVTELFPLFLAAEYVFPRLLRSALLGGTFSLFEHSLHALCRDFSGRIQARVRVDDLRGSGIGRARLFLERVAGVPFPSPDPLWEDIDRVRLLRNCIAHGTGELQDRSSVLGQFVRQHPYLEMDEGVGLHLMREFHGWAIERMETFVNRVMSHSGDGGEGDGAA